GGTGRSRVLADGFGGFRRAALHRRRRPRRVARPRVPPVPRRRPRLTKLAPVAPPRAALVELRVLDGPNLYFPRPAVKLTIAVGGWLDVPEERLASALRRAGANGRPGRPGSDQRRRTVARLAARLTWRLATTSRVRLAVRSRPGPEPDQVVVAFPWRRRGAAEALGLEVAPLLHEVGGRRSVARLLAEAAARVAEVEPGDEPEVTDPDIPVVSITGTNGKTTTVRLLAHIVRWARKTVAYS